MFATLYSKDLMHSPYIHTHVFTCMHACILSHFSPVQVFVTLWTIALQAPLSVGFSRQEYWSRLPCPPPGDLPDPGIKPKCLTPPALVGGFFTSSTIWEAHVHVHTHTQVYTHSWSASLALGNQDEAGSECPLNLTAREHGM